MQAQLKLSAIKIPSAIKIASVIKIASAIKIAKATIRIATTTVIRIKLKNTNLSGNAEVVVNGSVGVPLG